MFHNIKIYKMIKKTTLLFALFICIYSCGKKEPNTTTLESTYKYDTDSEQNSNEVSDTMMQNRNQVIEKIPKQLQMNKPLTNHPLQQTECIIMCIFR